MNKPVRAVEWVGDLSGPSVLPMRKPPLSPEPGLVIKRLMHDTSEIEDEPLQRMETGEPQEKAGELRMPEVDKKPTVSFSKQNQNQSPPHRSPSGVQPSAQAIYIDAAPGTEVSDLEVSDTMMSGALPVTTEPPKTFNAATGPSMFNTTTRHARRQPRVKKVPTASSRRPRRFRTSKASCCSLRGSPSSSQDFFTPPSSRFPSVLKVEHSDQTAEQKDDLRLALREEKNKRLRMSSGDSFAMESEQSNEQRPVARSSGRLDQAKAKMSRPVAAAEGPLTHARHSSRDAFSSLRSISRSYESIPASSPMLNQLAVQGNVLKQSRATSKKRKLADMSPDPKIAASSSHDFSSSLYSRPKSRVFRNHSKALDGGADATSPLQNPVCELRKSFSFEAGLHEFEALAEQRYIAAKKSEVWIGGKCPEISRLRIDNEALKQQLSDLRNEFRTLKDVLLQAESRRRWQGCVS
jgi:hypothetical protein